MLTARAEIGADENCRMSSYSVDLRRRSLSGRMRDVQAQAARTFS